MSFRVLIVDDSQTIRRSAELFIKTEPAVDLSMAEDGMSALIMLGKGTFDLVFLDVMMPGLSGLDTCNMIKKRPENKDVAVVMLSSKDSRFDMARAVIAGATEYLPKPFTKDGLLGVIRRYAKEKGVELSVAVAEPSAQSLPVSSLQSPAAPQEEAPTSAASPWMSAAVAAAPPADPFAAALAAAVGAASMGVDPAKDKATVDATGIAGKHDASRLTATPASQVEPSDAQKSPEPWVLEPLDFQNA